MPSTSLFGAIAGGCAGGAIAAPGPAARPGIDSGAATMPSGGNWVAVTNSPSVVSNGFQVTRQTTNSAEFFRLIRAAP